MQISDRDLIVDLGMENVRELADTFPEGISLIRLQDGDWQQTRTPLASSGDTPPVCWSESPVLVDNLVARIRKSGDARVVLLAHPESAETAVVSDALTDAGIQHTVLNATQPHQVSESDFIPADEADEVAARLRELGYL